MFLRDYPGATIKDISSYLGISINLARAVLYRLKNRGVVEKVGSGYILTKSGEQLVSKSSTPTILAEQQVQPKNTLIRGSRGEKQWLKRTSTMGREEKKAVGGYVDEIEKNVEVLERKISALENELENIKNELERLKKFLKEVKEGGKEKKSVKKEALEKLPKPVMPVLDAESILGDKLRSLTYTGKIIVIGSLAVDRDYYEEFISKFPISRREAEKLPEHEKILLEEMKKEGKVYLHGGKEYRLV